MPRRKKKQWAPETLLALAIVAGGFWLIVNALNQSGSLGIVVFVLILAGVCGVVFTQWPKWQLHKRLDACIDGHLETLVRRRAQLLYRDPYGNIQNVRWKKEVGEFINNTLVPTLSAREVKVLKKNGGRYVSKVADRVDAASQDGPAFPQFSADMTPAQFEAYCAEELIRYGWKAHVTKGSRDQGVDVIATKGAMRLVLQCKLYSNPVGNKAVQEVVAARTHERAQAGAVVTNNQYTTAARELAATNRILLLHYSDLARLDTLLATP